MNLRERPYLDVEVVEVKTKKKEEIPKSCVNCGAKAKIVIFKEV